MKQPRLNKLILSTIWKEKKTKSSEIKDLLDKLSKNTMESTVFLKWNGQMRISKYGYQYPNWESIKLVDSNGLQFTIEICWPNENIENDTAILVDKINIIKVT